MTARKHLKQLVRDRMRKTGERYTVARRHIVDADTSLGAPRRRPRRHRRVRERAGQPRRRRPAHRRAADRGDGARRRRRARRGLHPVGVRVAPVPLARAHARLPAPVAVPGPLGARDRRAARPARRAARDRRREGRRRGARRAARAAACRRSPGSTPTRSGTATSREWRDGYGGAAADRLRAHRRRVRDRRPLGGADHRAGRAARRGAGAGRLLQAPADHDRSRAGRARDLRAGRRGGAAAPGRAPEREVGLVLAAGVAQVGADDHRHAQQEGLAERVRRRARRRQPARVDLHQRGRTARTCAGCTPTSSTRRPGCWSARRCATPRPRGGRRRRAGRRSSTPRCRPATSCAS